MCCWLGVSVVCVSWLLLVAVGSLGLFVVVGGGGGDVVVCRRLCLCLFSCVIIVVGRARCC